MTSVVMNRAEVLDILTTLTKLKVIEYHKRIFVTYKKT